MHFQDLTVSIQQFMNGAAANLADRNEFRGAVQNEALFNQGALIIQ